MKIFNKKAPSAYNILERLEAGIALLGSEVKAVKTGHADLTGAYAKIIGSEAYLVNAKIFPYEFARVEGYDEARTRKLLLHKKEIIVLKSRLAQGALTLVPLSLYESKGYIKVQLALSRGKKKPDVKRAQKERDLKRETDIELKNLGRF